MRVIPTIAEWMQLRHTFPADASVGFVPTMGNLHQGHASLYERSRQDNQITIASLFVNPTQFNQTEDFIHYPRTLEADIELLREQGVDYCLLPTEDMMYPDGYHYQIHENLLSHSMEGASRPGHFDGVLTIVMKLFQLIKPTHAYFGEKDYQQLTLIQQMVKAFFMDIVICPCPTVRETSGLAYSSRNNRLTPDEKLIAEKFVKVFHKKSISCEDIRQELLEADIKVDYIMEEKNRRFAAVFIGNIRLIDNYSIL